MYNEDDLLPISALQHFIFCPRQCALIHVERLWAENQLTVEGQHLHRRADRPGHETRGDIRCVRSLDIRSLRHGLIGIADVVEFSQSDHGNCITPIEYKRGRPKKDDSDRVQLCAQAMCLEEMFDQSIERGYLFYGKQQRRTIVDLDARLRSTTLSTIDSLRAMIDQQHTPLASYGAKCEKCSLINLCLPKSLDRSGVASHYMENGLKQNLNQ